MKIIYDVFCPLPWIMSATKPDGHLRVCCKSHSVNDNESTFLTKSSGEPYSTFECGIHDYRNCESLKKIRKEILRGIKPKWCYYCYLYEERGMSMKRKYCLKEYKYLIPTILENTDNDGHIDIDKIPLVDFDLRLSNICNFNCALCSNINSIKKTGKVSDWSSKKYKYIREFLDNRHNINEIYFTGGEPFLIDGHWEILKDLIKDKASKNINLLYNTNGSKMEQYMFDLWDEFKSVNVVFSIDAIGKEAERIRKGTDWNKIEKNLLFFDEKSKENYKAAFTSTISMLNVLSYPELIRWFQEKNFKRIHMIDTNIAFDPFELSILGRRYLLKSIDDYYQDIKSSEINWIRNIYNIIVNSINEG